MITDVEPVAGRPPPSLSSSWERHHLGLPPHSNIAPVSNPHSPSPLQGHSSLVLQPTSSALDLQRDSTVSSQGLQPTSSNMAAHSHRMRGLRQSMTFPQRSGTQQQDLISLTDNPVLGLPLQSAAGVEAAAVEASPVSFAGMNLGPGAVVHDNPLSGMADLSPTPILPRLTIPGGSSSSQDLPSQMTALQVDHMHVHAVMLVQTPQSFGC